MKICNIPYWSLERWRPPLISFTDSTIFVCYDLYNSLYWSLNMALERKEEVFCLFLCMHNENAMIQLFPTLFGHMTLNTATVIPSSLSGIILKSWVFLPLQNLYGHGMMRRIVGVYDEGSKSELPTYVSVCKALIGLVMNLTNFVLFIYVNPHDNSFQCNDWVDNTVQNCILLLLLAWLNLQSQCPLRKDLSARLDIMKSSFDAKI